MKSLTFVAGALGLVLACPARGRAEGEEEKAKPPGAPRRVLPLSAREAVNLSLNHNLDIEVARYQPWIEEQNVYAALGTWDHVAYANVTETRDVQAGTSFLSGVPSGTRARTDTTAVTLGVRKTLPSGASYDLSFSSTRTDSNNSFYFFNPLWSDSGGGSITLPLLKGASTTANTSTLVIARHTRDISVDSFEKSLSDSVFATMQAYWDLVFAIENKKVKEQSLEVAQRLLDDNRRKFDRGVVARIDVTQADAGVAAQQEGILTAEAAVQLAMDSLKRLVDPALLRQETALQPVEGPRGFEAEIDERAETERALREALARRPEVRQITRQLATQDVVIAKSNNDLLPQLDLTGGAFLNGSESTFPQTYSDVRSREFHDLSAGIVFTWALEGSSARGSLNRAELEKRRLFLQQRNLENRVLVEVRDAVRQVKTNEKRIEANRRARVLAQDQLDGEMTRRDQGLSTTYRVLDVQQQLVQARTTELKALIDYNLSLHKVHVVTGELLEKNGILLQENLQPRVGVDGR
jgi:outer membrane protein